MFCTKCGKEFGAEDRFCGGCGQPRDAGDAPPGGGAPRGTADDWDWQTSFNYARIIEAKAVQHAFDLAQRRANQGVGLTDFIDLLTPVLPAPGKSVFSFTSKAGFSLVEKSGLAYEHRLPRLYEKPAGLVIAALACALAGRRCDVHDIRQGQEELTLLALIPATMWRSQYVLEAEIRREGAETELVLILKALLGGWAKGKSRRVADELFADIETYLEELSAQHP